LIQNRPPHWKRRADFNRAYGKLATNAIDRECRDMLSILSKEGGPAVAVTSGAAVTETETQAPMGTA